MRSAERRHDLAEAEASNAVVLAFDPGILTFRTQRIALGGEPRSVRTWRCVAPRRGLSRLAGHQDLGTTQRYMHLSPAALDAAIRLLETGIETSRVTVEK